MAQKQYASLRLQQGERVQVFGSVGQLRGEINPYIPSDEVWLVSEKGLVKLVNIAASPETKGPTR